MIDFVHGDVLRWAAEYDGPKFHAALMDPPYELSFMGKTWDGTGIAFRAETWAALGEHLLPGAFCMAFGGSRTYHRMACAIEDAGLIIHPAVVWCFGSGFPKSTRIDKQIDRAAGVEQEVVGINPNVRPNSGRTGGIMGEALGRVFNEKLTAPATDMARTWAGHRYGLQSLKPAAEFICVFQKPYAGRPVDSITEYGAGALWIEGGRVGTDTITQSLNGHNLGNHGIYGKSYGPVEDHTTAGRWPSNLLLDPCAAAALGRMSGERPSGGHGPLVKTNQWTADGRNGKAFVTKSVIEPDSGTAARFFQQCDWALEQAEPFFYCAKASRRERDAGLEGMEAKHHTLRGTENGREFIAPDGTKHRHGVSTPARCSHPTVKPIALARYLATLLLPPAEYAPRRILVPFAGVGSEAIGAALAGWEDVTGIEAEAEYVEMARARAAHWLMQPAFMMAEAAE